ncbi:MAG: prepilin-type N-terminal cleavage/methylation domain-containing protein [Desulfobacterales bacterium]
MRRESGFTAYELAVTLAVVAVLASVTLPSFLSWLGGHRLRGAAINAVSDIETAKIRAIRENALVAVRFEPDGYRIFIDNGTGSGEAGNFELDSGERLVQDRRLPAGVRIPMGELTLSEHCLHFNSRGLPANLNESDPLPIVIPMVNDTGRKEISLNRIGSVTTQ